MGMFWKNTTTDSRCGKAEFEDLQEHAETGTKDDLLLYSDAEGVH
jgi:hypothetical protein